MPDHPDDEQAAARRRGRRRYRTERFELPIVKEAGFCGVKKADFEAAVSLYSDDAEIQRCVDCARNVLAAAGYDVGCPPGLLLGETRESEAGHLAARVIYHAAGMDQAERGHGIRDMRHHAMRFMQAVTQAQHLEAWPDVGRPPVLTPDDMAPLVEQLTRQGYQGDRLVFEVVHLTGASESTVRRTLKELRRRG